jgi:KAP family P-loop domain
MGAAARAVTRAVTLSAALAGGIVEASMDLGKIFDGTAVSAAVGEPTSAYHASFTMMAEAVTGFVHAGGRQGGSQARTARRRIVVFIDDLDRCLPSNALSVLEAMKLFFDLDGFVFVAGLDQRVIEQAVDTRYRPTYEGASTVPPQDQTNEESDHLMASHGRVVTGRDYIKKIFQVPFGLPAVDQSGLEDLVGSLARSPGVSVEQRKDLRTRVVTHLRYYADDGPVNAREIKRLINAYTVQLKLLSRRLDDPIDLDTILALQVIAFRSDWDRIWKRLQADPDDYANRLNEGLAKRDADTAWVDGEPLPPRLVDYLDIGPAKPLLINVRLPAYLLSSQVSHRTEPLVLRAQVVVDDLRRYVRGVDETTDRSRLSVALRDRLDAWNSIVSSADWAPEVLPLVARLENDVITLAESDGTPIGEWADGFRARLERLDNDLRTIRERYGPRAS